MTTLLESSGGGPQKQPKYVPIFMDRAFTGLYTQRAVLHDPSDVYTSRFYGGRPDALLTGRNVELTNRLTLQRRPGLSLFGGGSVYPTAPNRAFSFQLANGSIQVIIDTTSSGLLAITSCANASAGTTVYNGTFPGGASNGYAGLIFNVTGFVTNPSNNGVYTCTASSATTLTLTNAVGVAETQAATAITTGGVYVDNQNGTKTLLFGKAVGAGQAFFISVGGVLYVGDGIDTKKYTPLNLNTPPGSSVSVWNWGIASPTKPPAVQVTASGAAASVWNANTVFTTMGLTVDTFGQVWQLVGANADGSNTANAIYATTGNGSPIWNQGDTFPTTTESSGTPIVWRNNGQIKQWQASTLYAAGHLSGVAGETTIFDPVSQSFYMNFHGHGALLRSGLVKPPFNGVVGSNFYDGNGPEESCHWYFIGKYADMQPWKPSRGYTATGAAGLVAPTAQNSVIEPFIIPPPDPTKQPIYIQIPTNTGTSGSTYTPFSNGASIGALQPDGQALWLALGSGTWVANTQYNQWQAQGTTFGVISDGVNMQVCAKSGTSGAVKPGTTSALTAVANAVGGNTTYTGTFSPVLTPGQSVVISGFTLAANNGKFLIISSTATTLVVNNPAGVAATQAATSVFNPWSTAYGQTTNDGSVTWVCVGPQITWAASTLWHLPLSGFQPPQASQAYGGSTVNSSTSLVETVVVSGKSGTVAPTWSANKLNTSDNPVASLTLTQVAVNSDSTTTYTGTITGGAANALAGLAFLISGFVNTGNNILIYVTASTATTLVCSTTSQVNETHAGTAARGLTWYAESVVLVNSLVWSFGLTYAYSYKARPTSDFYSPVAIGGGGAIPPGSTFGALGAPTGSATNAISSASPPFIITGGNVGAVNTISGLGSLDPQVDTIVIWRSADIASGAGVMFELTEIPAPKPINGLAQPWSFQDFLPSVANATYPGLNVLLPAPINNVNDPPPTNFQPMVYNYQRIWGASGQTVPFSGGPDTQVGNPNEAFKLANNLPFLAPVIRLVRTPQGIITFLTNSVEMIGGGPATATFFSVTMVPGIGLLSYNACDVFAGEIYFFSSDNTFRVITPSLNLSNFGFPLGDQFANQPSFGTLDTTWDPTKAYVAVHQSGTDNCIFVSDGSTGWYRLNPHQVPGAAQGPEPIWSPFAAITGGAQMVQSVEVSPGIKKLLVGPTTSGSSILVRNLLVFTDNGTLYDAQFTMGSISLAHSGQLAILKHLEFDFSGVKYQPTISYLLNELSGTFTSFVNGKNNTPQFDPPSLYGDTLSPATYSPNRYYFTANQQIARCRHMQIKVDFGSTANGDELYNMTIFGRLMVET